MKLFFKKTANMVTSNEQLPLVFVSEPESPIAPADFKLTLQARMTLRFYSSLPPEFCGYGM